MPRLDLRGPAKQADVTLTGYADLSDLDRKKAIGTWHGRMVNEHVSARVFAGLIPQMMRAGLDAEWQAEVATMVSDELRHGRQCAAMVHALGGEPVAELPELQDIPIHTDVAPLEGFLRNIINISCMSETVAVALIGAEMHEADPPEMKETLKNILADEVQHARFGWKVLRELAPQLDAEVKERLSDYLVVAFKTLREHELHYLPENDKPSDAAAAVGVCNGTEARQLFFDTVKTVIIPGLEEHGLQAELAWKASYV